MYIIGCISQKGGVGKSAIARLLARDFAAADYRTKIADLDVQQSTSTRWLGDRAEAGLKPEIEGAFYKSVGEAIRDSAGVEVLIFDGKPSADAQAVEVAKKANLVVIPTGAGVDDLRPTVQLHHALLKAGVPRVRMLVVLVAQMTEAEESDARAVLENAGLAIASHALRRKPMYQQALNQGQAFTEVRHPQLREEAALLAEEIANKMMEDK